MAIPRRPTTQRIERRAMWRDLQEGARYAWQARPIRVLLIVLAVVSFMATPYQPLMPAFVRELFDGVDRRPLAFSWPLPGSGPCWAPCFCPHGPGMRDSYR